MNTKMFAAGLCWVLLGGERLPKDTGQCAKAARRQESGEPGGRKDAGSQGRGLQAKG